MNRGHPPVFIWILWLVTAFVAAVAGLPQAAPSADLKSAVVPGNVPWTNSRVRVTRGERLRFAASGEILLSYGGDDVAVATGATNGRMSAHAPFPGVYLGTLIGRINSGKPFLIGSGQTVEMPATGTLFLGVNDDHVADNSGNYVVKIWHP